MQSSCISRSAYTKEDTRLKTRPEVLCGPDANSCRHTTTWISWNGSHYCLLERLFLASVFYKPCLTPKTQNLFVNGQLSTR